MLGSGGAVPRGFWLSFFAVLSALAVLFAAYPSFDVEVADWFFDPGTADFPLSHDPAWKLIRRGLNWLPFLFLLPVGFALARKLIRPSERMTIAPSAALFLVGTLLLGPGVVSNMLLKEHWGRPRPNGIEQFAGTASFKPWWQPSDACRQNCSFVSGEASLAFWTAAPASLAPPQIRSAAIGGAVVFGTAVGSLRVAFGRHFASDIVFAGIITLAIVFALYRFLLEPLRRNDAALERGLERAFMRLHRVVGTVLAAIGEGLANLGSSLRSRGQHLRDRVA